jgi:outer membrane receptor protein involved in Fe transport
VFSHLSVTTRRRARLLAFSLPLVLSLGLSPAGAQQSPSPDAVPTIVVTGVPTPASEVASSVTIVTDKDIATQQVRAVPDALNTVPGLNVVQTGGPGGQTSVFTRGSNSNHTKVLVDGIDVGDPSKPNGAFDYAHLLTSDIQQIEVLRGPQSGLYGSDAIGGMISIITRRGDGPPRATASIETGSFKTFNQSAGLSGSQDNFNYAFNVVRLNAGDVPVTPLQLLPHGQRAIGNNYDNMTYSTRLGADLNENWAVNSVVRYTDATLLFTGDGGFPSVPNPTQSRHTVHHLFTREEAVWSLFDGRIKDYFGVNIANNWTSDIAPGDPISTVTSGDRLKYDWHAVTELAPGSNFVVGLEQQNDRLSTTGFSAENGNKAGFVELQTDFARRFFLVANMRDDINDQFGAHATYRIAPAVIIPVTETKLKASYGTGFKAPDAERAVPKLSRLELLRQSQPEAGTEHGLRRRLRAAAIRRPGALWVDLFPQQHHRPDQHQRHVHLLCECGPCDDRGDGELRLGDIDRPLRRSGGLHLHSRGGRHDRHPIAAAAEAEMEHDGNMGSDRPAHVVGDRASHQRLARRHARRHDVRDRGAGLHHRQFAGRLCNQRPGQGVRAGR